MRRLLLVVLVLMIVGAVAAVVVPVWLIQPFRAQTPTELGISYFLRSWSSSVTLLAGLAVLTLAAILWNGSRGWWRKSLLVGAGSVAILAAVLARVNHFELMFNPAENPGYEKAATTSFLTDTDMVMAVTRGQDAVAYPVRLLAYHHIVQDMVGGTPVVATY